MLRIHGLFPFQWRPAFPSRASMHSLVNNNLLITYLCISSASLLRMDRVGGRVKTGKSYAAEVTAALTIHRRYGKSSQPDRDDYKMQIQAGKQ